MYLVSISVHFCVSDRIYGEVNGMEIAFVFMDFFRLLMLLVGIVLTVITVRRMVHREICVPSWAKVLLTAGMILLQLILLLSILPPIEINVDNPFVDEQTHIVTPVDPSESIAVTE